MVEITLARDLGRAWKQAQETSGYLPGSTDTDSSAFYAAFEESTGLKEEMVSGLFNDWNRLSRQEMLEIASAVPAENPFCGYLAIRISKVVGAAGTCTAYGDFVGEED